MRRSLSDIHIQPIGSEVERARELMTRYFHLFGVSKVEYLCLKNDIPEVLLKLIKMLGHQIDFQSSKQAASSMLN